MRGNNQHKQILQVILVLLAASCYGLARPSILNARLNNGSEAIWTPCPDDGKFDCATITVPKDYFNAAAGNASIAAKRYRHTNQDFRGSLFINPGGPGGSGFAGLPVFALLSEQIMNGHYNIVGFDPRGIGATRPRVECFPSDAAFNLFQASTVMETAFDQPPDPFSEAGKEVIQNQYRRQLALQQTQYQTCGQAMGDELRYMGTTTVARDVAFMADLLDGPGAPINFFGISYGTVLGAYLVNMFPDRVGKVVFDGVVNPVIWAQDAHHTWAAQWLNATEAAHRFFPKECSEAGPNLCPLAQSKGEDPNAIDQRLLKFFDGLYYQPMAASNHTCQTILTSGMARGKPNFPAN